jgi:hypothetical protein
MRTPWELDGNTLVIAYKIWKLSYGSSSSQGRESGYVLLRLGIGWGFESQPTGIPTSIRTSLMFLVQHKRVMGVCRELKSQLEAIPYPTTCLLSLNEGNL